MRPFVFSFLFLISVGVALAQVSVGGPTPGQDPNYPLRVRILTRNASRGPNGLRMWGRADLFGGAQAEQGFDYESTCDEVVMVTHGDERYSARWKKQDRELEMLLSKVGTGKATKCSVKTDLQQFTYEFEGGTRGPVVTKPLAK
jgi:hypothetical protein